MFKIRVQLFLAITFVFFLLSSGQAMAVVGTLQDSPQFQRERGVESVAPERRCFFRPTGQIAYSRSTDVMAIPHRCGRDWSHGLALHSSSASQTTFIDSICGDYRIDSSGAVIRREDGTNRGIAAAIVSGQVFGLSDGRFVYICRQSRLGPEPEAPETGRSYTLLFAIVDARNLSDVTQQIAFVQFPATYPAGFRVHTVSPEGVLYGTRLSPTGSQQQEASLRLPLDWFQVDLAGVAQPEPLELDTISDRICAPPNGDVVWERCSIRMQRVALGGGRLLVSEIWRPEYASTLQQTTSAQRRFDIERLGDGAVVDGELAVSPIASIVGRPPVDIEAFQAGRLVYSYYDREGRGVGVINAASGESVQIRPVEMAGRDDSYLTTPVLTPDGRFLIGNLTYAREILVFDLENLSGEILFSDAYRRLSARRSPGPLIVTGSGRVLSVSRNRIRYITTYLSERG